MDTLLTLGLNLVSLSLTIISTVVFIQNSYSQKMSRYFTACQILIINWIVCHIFDIFTTNLSVKIILSNIGYFCVCTLGPVLLIFALHYTKAATIKSKIFKTAVFLPSTILFLLKITDPIFHLFFNRRRCNIMYAQRKRKLCIWLSAYLKWMKPRFGKVSFSLGIFNRSISILYSFDNCLMNRERLFNE